MNEIAIRQSAEKINKLHEGINASMKRNVQDAINIGAELGKVKKEVGHGNFINWINDNCGFSERTSRNYQMIYKHRSKTATVADLKDAYKVVEQIEWKEKNKENIQASKEREERVKEKFKDIKKEPLPDDFFKTKEKTFDDSKFEQIKEQLEKEIEAEEKFKKSLGVTDGNKNQDAFFDVISRYCNGLKNDNERREALHNIIKYCKKKILEFERV